MRLAAQRVRDLQGHEGINSFCYYHGPITWFDRPPAEVTSSSGTLVNSHIAVTPGGNRVRSYLDIWTPDETPSLTIEEDVVSCIDLLQDEHLPIDLQSGECTFHFDLEAALAPGWRRELVVLLHRALDARV